MLPKINNGGVYANTAVSTSQKAEKELSRSEQNGGVQRENSGRMDKIQITHTATATNATESLPPVTFSNLKGKITQSLRADTAPEKVQNIKQQVQGGQYYVKASEAAKAML